MKEMVSKRDAEKRGLCKYYTGEECKNGHQVERYTKSDACVECVRIWQKRSRQKNRWLHRLAARQNEEDSRKCERMKAELYNPPGVDTSRAE